MEVFLAEREFFRAVLLKKSVEAPCFMYKVADEEAVNVAQSKECS